jgi:hypothetical protein
MADQREYLAGKSTKDGRNRRAALVFGTLGFLPFAETLIFNAIVGRESASWDMLDILVTAPLVVILWVLMTLSFVLRRSQVLPWLRKLKERLYRYLIFIKKRIYYSLFLLLIAYLVLFFGGKDVIRFVSGPIIGSVIVPMLQLALAILMIWLLNFVLKSLSAQVSTGLREALDEWRISIQFSVVFYILLIAASWKLIQTSGIDPEWRLEFLVALIKDYVLLFIIVEMLYVGLFKIALAESLAAVFQSIKGFFQFVVICGIIAVFAVWADFNSMDSVNVNAFLRFDWQKTLYRIHVYVRDIGLLLVPITGLLFWTLLRFGQEKDPDIQQNGV